MKTAVGPREEFIIKKKTRCKVTHLKHQKPPKGKTFQVFLFGNAKTTKSEVIT
jgi:hypothetical protein